LDSAFPQTGSGQIRQRCLHNQRWLQVCLWQDDIQQAALERTGANLCDIYRVPVDSVRQELQSLTPVGQLGSHRIVAHCRNVELSGRSKPNFTLAFPVDPKRRSIRPPITYLAADCSISDHAAADSTHCKEASAVSAFASS